MECAGCKGELCTATSEASTAKTPGLGPLGRFYRAAALQYCGLDCIRISQLKFQAAFVLYMRIWL